MKTSTVIAEKLSNAELVLNIDGGGGTLNEKIGVPEYFTCHRCSGLPALMRAHCLN